MKRILISDLVSDEADQNVVPGGLSARDHPLATIHSTHPSPLPTQHIISKSPPPPPPSPPPTHTLCSVTVGSPGECPAVGESGTGALDPVELQACKLNQVALDLARHPFPLAGRGREWFGRCHKPSTLCWPPRARQQQEDFGPHLASRSLGAAGLWGTMH